MRSVADSSARCSVRASETQKDVWCVRYEQGRRGERNYTRRTLHVLQVMTDWSCPEKSVSTLLQLKAW